MATEESNIVNKLRCEASERGDKLFRNNRGKFRTLDGLRIVEAGLSAAGSSDLIGWTQVKITPDMVGDVVAIFTAIECKTAKGKIKSKQQDFIDLVNEVGGYGSIYYGE